MDTKSTLALFWSALDVWNQSQCFPTRRLMLWLFAQLLRSQEIRLFTGGDRSVEYLVPWAGSKTFSVTFCSNCFLKCSHAVLSVIFGILGKFRIGIGNQIFFIESFFVEKNPKHFGRRKKKLVEKYFLGRFFGLILCCRHRPRPAADAKIIKKPWKSIENHQK